MNPELLQPSALRYHAITDGDKLVRHAFHVSPLTQGLLNELATQTTTKTINNVLCAVEQGIDPVVYPIECKQLASLGVL